MECLPIPWYWQDIVVAEYRLNRNAELPASVAKMFRVVVQRTARASADQTAINARLGEIRAGVEVVQANGKARTIKAMHASGDGALFKSSRANHRGFLTYVDADPLG